MVNAEKIKTLRAQINAIISEGPLEKDVEKLCNLQTHLKMRIEAELQFTILDEIRELQMTCAEWHDVVACVDRWFLNCVRAGGNSHADTKAD